MLIDTTESCIELAGFSGGTRRDLDEFMVGAGEESGRAPDILTELRSAEEAAVDESTTKSVKVGCPAVCGPVSPAFMNSHRKLHTSVLVLLVTSLARL